MDLVGPISPVTSAGNKYILTVIDMLMGYTVAVPIPDKKSEIVCGMYRDNVYCTFGGSLRILTDNGTEFKSQEMKTICEELNIKHVFSPVYTPQANGRLEGWHRFLKACIAKNIHGTDLEWDKLVPLAISAYNFFPCQSSRESPFVLMFERDPIAPIAKLLEPLPRYYGDKGGTLRMDTLRKLYMVTAENIHRVREKVPQRETSNKLQVGDLVFVRDPDSGVFEPCHSQNYRIITIHGANRIEVQDEKGHRLVRRAGHVKRIEPVDKVCQQLPPEEVYKQFGRASKLLLHPKDVPNINLGKGKEMINCKNKQGNKKDDSITLCELTEELDSHEKLEKSINTVFSTNIVHDVMKEEGVDKKSSKESIHRLGNDSPTEHTGQWTSSRKCIYPSDYSEKSLNRLGDVESCAVSPMRGKEVICNEHWKQTIIRYRVIKAKNCLFAAMYWKGIYTM